MTKTIEDINLETWFMERELLTAPAHFVKVNTTLTPEARIWILEKLRGRFSISHSIFSSGGGPYEVAFEDPKEAMFYELTWG